MSENTISKIRIQNIDYKIIDSRVDTLKLNEDYTAFEVFAHDYDISIGEYTQVLSDGATFSNKDIINKNMTHLFVLRTMCIDYTKSDVIVDWGDGNISIIANGDFNKETDEHYDRSADISDGEAFYTLEHTYQASGKYIVKIYGTQYYNIKSYISDTDYNSNLISRIFDYDLPIASHLFNLSAICYNASRLLYVNAESIKYKTFKNISQLFFNCINLQQATGFKRNFSECALERAFCFCSNLIKTDIQLPTRSGYITCNSTFAGCSKLAIDINKFIPDSGLYQPLSLYQTFRGCSSLYGTISEFTKSQLWNNHKVEFTNQIDCFLECSDEIRAQVPVSWGGTASDNIIEKSDKDKIAELTSRLEILEQYIQNNPSITDDTLEFE